MIPRQSGQHIMEIHPLVCAMSRGRSGQFRVCTRRQFRGFERDVQPNASIAMPQLRRPPHQDSAQPCTKRRSPIEPLYPAIGGDQRLLEDILGIVLRARKRARQPEQVARMEIHDGMKRHAIAPSRLPGQFDVAVRQFLTPRRFGPSRSESLFQDVNHIFPAAEFSASSSGVCKASGAEVGVWLGGRTGKPLGVGLNIRTPPMTFHTPDDVNSKAVMINAQERKLGNERRWYSISTAMKEPQQREVVPHKISTIAMPIESCRMYLVPHALHTR